MLKNYLKLVVLILFTTIYGYSAITGSAYRDYNADGIKQGGEHGVANIIVKAYVDDPSGKDSFLAQTTTDTNGNYSLNIPANKFPVRLEFQLPNNACNVKKGVEYPSAGGAAYGTSVQFAKADGETHNFAISYPYDFSTQENPYTFVPIQINGNPTGTGTTASSPALAKFKFKNEGHAPNSGRGLSDGQAWIELAKQNQIGTTYGEAYSRQARKVFVSAIMKRHTGFGPLGTGGIYIIDPDKNSSQQSNVNFLNLDSVGIETSKQNGTYTNALNGNDKVNFSPVVGSNVDRGLPKDLNQPSNDSAAYGQAGRVSLGDTDISEDGQYLYVANLYKKNIVQIDLTDPKNPVAPTATNAAQKIKEITPPNPCTENGNNYGEMVPFALKVTKGLLYVGITCTGADQNGNSVVSDNSGMKGFIYHLDLSNGTSWTKDVDWSFGYRNNDGSGKPWNLWTNTWNGDYEHPIPLVSDIEFDNSGNLLVGVMDVQGNKKGYNNYALTGTKTYNAATAGDLLRFVKNSSTCSYSVNLAKEFYDDANAHTESTGGALAGHHTSNKDSVLSLFLDPYKPNGGSSKTWYSNGTMLYDNTTGKTIDVNGDGKYGYEIVYTNLNYMGKANALGDIETMEFTPPIEIGNLVWEDKDKDGVQDAGEPGIKGAKLFLSQGTDCSNKIAETTTDANGNYMFNYANVNPNSNTPGLQADTDYTVCIDKSQFDNGKGLEGTALEGMYVTSNDETGTSDNPDKTDSDAQIDGEGYVYIKIHTKGPGQNDHSLDFGFIKTVCIGDRIWRDDNNNGIQDANEVNVADSVKVELSDENGTKVKDYQGNDVNFKTTTDGKYEFCDLNPGKYKVKFTFPNNYEVSPKKADNNDTINSDVNPSTNETDVIDVQKYNHNVDLGLFEPACIGDKVWHDINGDGVQNSGEPGKNKVKVELFNANGLVDTTETNTTGGYEFCGLIPGDYYVKVTPPTGYIISPKDAGGDDTKDNDMNRTTGKTDMTTLEPGEKDHSWDAGIYKPACIGDYTWLDENVDGIQNDTEKALNGVTVTLLDESGNEVTAGADGSAYTNTQVTGQVQGEGKGKYHFCNLKPGTYKVKFTMPHDANGAPYLSTTNEGGDDSKDSDIEKFKDAKDGLISTPVSVKSEDDNRSVDAGFIQEICLGDKVWEDMNANGIQDNGEPALANIPVELMMKDNSGAWVPAKNVKGVDASNTETNSTGKYSFCHLKPAIDYKIIFTKPTGYYVTDKDKGDDTKDSDIDTNSEITVVKPVKDDYSLDAGFFRPACIGDKVWVDKNANGIQDTNELGLDNVKVELLQNGSTAIRDVDGNDITALITKNGGKYHFGKVGNECKLKPGKYSLRFTTPDGYYYTRKDTTNDSNDSDVQEQFAYQTGTTVKTELTSGEDDTTWDAGVFKPACIGDFIWDDKNANGVQDSNETALKDDNGTIIPVKVTLVPKTDAFGNINNEYVNGNAITFKDTNATGGYKFCNLVPGDYQVSVKVPDSYVVTRENVGDDNNDSDLGKFLDSGDVTMPKETLSSGEDNTTFDGGVFKPSCIGSTIWFDKNANGIKDANEDGIADVNVTLRPVVDEFGNENNQTAYKQPYKMITTLDDGKYEFCNLIPGKYKVRFKAPLKDGAPLLTTKKNAGDDTKDSDTPEYQQGVVESDVVTLGSRENNPTVFAGFIQKICLGDKVWFDENLNGVQDNKELGVTDLKVHLTYADGSTVKDVYGKEVKVTKTDNNGKYKFCDLYPARDYKIKVDMPDGYLATPSNKGSDTKDSDANDAGFILIKNPVVDNYTEDMGIYCSCDDYKVHPEKYKKLSAPTLNIVGLLVMLTAVFVLVRRED